MEVLPEQAKATKPLTNKIHTGKPLLGSRSAIAHGPSEPLPAGRTCVVGWGPCCDGIIKDEGDGIRCVAADQRMM